MSFAARRIQGSSSFSVFFHYLIVCGIFSVPLSGVVALPSQLFAPKNVIYTNNNRPYSSSYCTSISRSDIGSAYNEGRKMFRAGNIPKKSQPRLIHPQVNRVTIMLNYYNMTFSSNANRLSKCFNALKI